MEIQGKAVTLTEQGRVVVEPANLGPSAEAEKANCWHWVIEESRCLRPTAEQGAGQLLEELGVKFLMD